MYNIYEKKYIKYKKKYLITRNSLEGGMSDADKTLTSELISYLRDKKKNYYYDISLDDLSDADLYNKLYYKLYLNQVIVDDLYSDENKLYLDSDFIYNALEECIAFNKIFSKYEILNDNEKEFYNKYIKLFREFITLISENTYNDDNKQILTYFFNTSSNLNNFKKCLSLELINEIIMESEKLKLIKIIIKQLTLNNLLTNASEKKFEVIKEIIDSNKIFESIENVEEFIKSNKIILILLFEETEIEQIFTYCYGYCYPEYNILLNNLIKICKLDNNLTTICTKFKKNFIENLFINSNPQICYNLYKKKNKKYYIHTCNPEQYIASMDENIRYKFNSITRENCCNCISIVLYTNFSNESSITDLKRTHIVLDQYFTSMVYSLTNVTKHLPNFIIRYYLDSSIFNFISILLSQNLSNFNKFKKIITNLSTIIAAENSEVYILSCPSIHNNFKANYRTYRFLPLFDESVNIFISREADGYVSISDCHNIALFSDSNKLALFYNIINNNYSFNFNNLFNFICYSYWLRLYIYFNEKNINPYFDILAGCFGIKNIFNKDELDKFLKDFNQNFKNIILNLKEKNYKTNVIHKYHNILIDYYIRKLAEENMIKTLQIGYDELFLLDLFQPLNIIDDITKDKVIIESEIERKSASFIILNQLDYYIINDNPDEIKEFNELDIIIQNEITNFNKLDITKDKLIKLLEKNEKTVEDELPILFKDELPITIQIKLIIEFLLLHNLLDNKVFFSNFFKKLDDPLKEELIKKYRTDKDNIFTDFTNLEEINKENFINDIITLLYTQNKQIPQKLDIIQILNSCLDITKKLVEDTTEKLVKNIIVEKLVYFIKTFFFSPSNYTNVPLHKSFKIQKIENFEFPKTHEFIKTHDINSIPNVYNQSCLFLVNHKLEQSLFDTIYSNS